VVVADLLVIVNQAVQVDMQKALIQYHQGKAYMSLWAVQVTVWDITAAVVKAEPVVLEVI
jgi:hypothetical protein